MGMLLLLVGLLAAASGGIKLRGHYLTGMGIPKLAGAELAVGLLVIIGAGTGWARTRPLAWAAVAVVALVLLISSVAHLRRWLRERDRRAASERSRLERHLAGGGMPPGGTKRYL